MMAHDPSLFAGGAALHALDEEESVQFEQHLRDCPTCQAELTGFQETAARLGSASAESPPASMRAAVLAKIAVTRQLPPQVSHSLDDQVAAREQSPPETPIAEERMAAVVDLASRRRRVQRMLLTAAVTIAIALAAFSAVFLLNRNDPADDQAQCLSSAADLHQVAATPGSAGVANVAVSASCGAARVRLSDIPAPTAGTTYQLWVISGDQVRSVRTMDPDADGTMPETIATVQVGDTALGVTVEPAGGSEKPTSAPVITIPLAG